MIGFIFRVLLVGAGRAVAQTAATGALGGTVTDPSGAPTAALGDSFGTITRTSANPCIIQLGVKFFL